MKIKLSGRTNESKSAIQALVNSLEKFGEVQEEKENILKVDGREKLLVAFSSSSYYQKKICFLLIMVKTTYMEMVQWNADHAWMVMICEGHGNFFVPINKVKPLLTSYPSNRQDGRWDLYIRFTDNHAYLGITKAQNHFDVTSQWHSFEQIWQNPGIEESYDTEAIYVPDSLPEPQRKMGSVVRVVRDTSQSKFVKELYDYQCQICGLTILVPTLKSGKYCEAHHVQPLGRLYNGPDHTSNIVALCPNHHSMMDLGVIAIYPNNLRVIFAFNNYNSLEPNAVLQLKGKHGLKSQYLAFHLKNIYLGETILHEVELNNEQF